MYLELIDAKFLIELCEDSSLLMADETIASAVKTGNGEKILTYLREQREWFGALPEHARACFRNRGNNAQFNFALLAMQKLTTYEQYRRATA